MVGEAAENKLYDAAVKGDVTLFQNLLQRDPNLVEEISHARLNRTPLHVATLHGNVAIVAQILQRNPQLSLELDSERSSPLHIAAARGDAEIASALLSAAPSMCWSCDCHGMNPVHVAAMNGHVGILRVLIDADPFPAMEKLEYRGQSVLQLCVKRRRCEALEYLVERVGEIVYAEDDDGETVLHSAVRFNQVEVISITILYIKFQLIFFFFYNIFSFFFSNLKEKVEIWFLN